MSYTRTYAEAYTSYAKLTINGSTIYNTPNTVVLNGERTGEKVLDWQQKVRSGQDATSNYFTDRQKVESRVDGVAALSGSINQGTLSEASTSQVFRGQITAFANLVHHTVSEADADSLARAETFKRIRKEQEAWAGLSALAEIGGVIRQFGSPFKAISKLTNNYLDGLDKRRKGIPSRNFKTDYLKLVTDSYLEYAFGLAPLISDTRAAAEALARFNYEKTGEQRFRKKVVGRGAQTYVTSNTNTVLVPDGWFVGNRTIKQTTETNVQYTCGLDMSSIASFGSQERLQQILGFKPENWLPALWEFAPWSWLVDYFTNVGDIINASVTNTSSVIWVSKTVKTKSTMVVSTPVNGLLTAARIRTFGWTPSGGSGQLGGFTQIRTTLTRTKGATLSMPTLVFSLPERSTQLANMAAVLLGRQSAAPLRSYDPLTYIPLKVSRRGRKWQGGNNGLLLPRKP